MKILAINGSPRKDGNTASILKSILNVASDNGNEVEIVNIYDLDLKGCLGCNKCKNEKKRFCVIDDGLQSVYPKIVESDVLVFGSPIYIGHVTGPMKIFIDRLYTFGKVDYTMTHLPGKKFVTVLTSGAPKDTYKAVEEYLQSWFIKFFKMEDAGSIIAGSMINQSDAKNNKELLLKAKEIAEKL